MIFETWLAGPAAGLGMTVAQTATFLAFIFIAGFDIVLAIAAGRNSGMAIIAGSVIGVCFFLFMGWVPGWLGVVLAMLGTFYFIDKIRERF